MCQALRMYACCLKSSLRKGKVATLFHSFIYCEIRQVELAYKLVFVYQHTLQVIRLLGNYLRVGGCQQVTLREAYD